MTYLRGALAAALLAMPMAGAAGQSASQHDPPASAASDSAGGHRLVWVVGAGAAGGALFTSFVRLSERGAPITADRGLTIPGSPVPNHYTDGTLPGSGVSPGQNTPLPGKIQPPSQDSSSTNGDSQTGVVGDPGPGPQNPPNNGPPSNDPPSNDQPMPPGPPGPPGNNQTDQQPPPSPDQLGSVGIVVTTPEPESIFLLGTGVIALLPAYRRRRVAS